MIKCFYSKGCICHVWCKGSRGVILIETKQGKKESRNFGYLDYGLQK